MLFLLGQSVTAVDAEVRAGDVPRGIAEQEGDGAHEVLGAAHFALRDEAGPFLGEDGVFVEDFLGAEFLRGDD
jgi:hypothetical protein